MSKYYSKSKANIDDLLFEKRNKSYGAYLLRKTYASNMSKGLAISIASLIALLVIPSLQCNDGDEIYRMTEVSLESPPVPILPKQVSNPAGAKLEEKKAKQKESLQKKSGNKPKIVKEELPETANTAVMKDTLSKESEKQMNISDSAAGKQGKENEGDLAIEFADVMPEFPGGQRALLRFIQSKLSYPGSAVRSKTEGVVYIGFIIDKNGRLRNPKILKSLSPDCDEEALRVVRLIPDWIPAKNQGRNVSINFRLPIEFKLIR